MSSITVRKDLRGRFGPARDQGLRPTCLAFATSDAHAAVRDTTWCRLSCEYLYYHAKQAGRSARTSGVKIAFDPRGTGSGWAADRGGVAVPEGGAGRPELDAASRRSGRCSVGRRRCSRAGFAEAWAAGDGRHAGLDRHVHLGCLLHPEAWRGGLRRGR